MHIWGSCAGFRDPGFKLRFMVFACTCQTRGLAARRVAAEKGSRGRNHPTRVHFERIQERTKPEASLSPSDEY